MAKERDNVNERPRDSDRMGKDKSGLKTDPKPKGLKSDDPSLPDDVFMDEEEEIEEEHELDEDEEEEEEA